jgi:hypothetical protein
MEELNFAQVRAAGLPARVELAFATYEYRPLSDDVAVRICPPRPCTTTRMPETGWHHLEGCPCPYCQAAGEAVR